MNKKRFFPVIHCIPSETHSLLNVRLAIENGADGVFLIGHNMSHLQLYYIYKDVRKQFPHIWIGINFLDIGHDQDWRLLSKVARELEKLNGLWIDSLPSQRLNLPTNIEVFGGVAFKYIDPHIRGERLKESCEKALEVVDTVTTNGIGTGSAPDISKLKEIRKNIGETPRLALASGVTEDNVSLFLPTVDTFLVATSITGRDPDLNNDEYLIPEKVSSLATLIHSYKERLV